MMMTCLKNQRRRMMRRKPKLKKLKEVAKINQHKNQARKTKRKEKVKAKNDQASPYFLNVNF